MLHVCWFFCHDNMHFIKLSTVKFLFFIKDADVSAPVVLIPLSQHHSLVLSNVGSDTSNMDSMINKFDRVLQTRHEFGAANGDALQTSWKNFQGSRRCLQVGLFKPSNGELSHRFIFNLYTHIWYQWKSTQHHCLVNNLYLQTWGWHYRKDIYIYIYLLYSYS